MIVNRKTTNTKTITIESEFKDKNEYNTRLYVLINKDSSKGEKEEEIETSLTACNIDRHKTNDSIAKLQDYITEVLIMFEKLQYELDKERMGIDKSE